MSRGFSHRACLGGALAAALLLSGAGVEATGVVHRGRVIHVADGDSLVVQGPGGRLRVELAGLDAPEIDQPYGPRARRAVARLAFGRTIAAVERARDEAGRVVATVYVGRLQVNADLVGAGHAWACPGDGADSLAGLERAARDRRLGLWASVSRVPPWAWRAGARRASDPPAGARCALAS